jgi:hypothetical protein
MKRAGASKRQDRPRRVSVAALRLHFADKTSISKMSVELGMMPHAGKPPAP